MILIITSCSASKDDSNPIPADSRAVHPADYLDDHDLISSLLKTRERVFQDPRSRVGSKNTYAFDLYAKAGNAYRDLRENNYQRTKSAVSSKIEWFFLSGGYGIIHALEAAKRYQATFSRGIAYQKKIPFTGNLWKTILTRLCDAVVSKSNPEWIYVFGSQDYTRFIKQTNFWRADNVKMFESTGSSGPHWLSPTLNQLANSILNDSLHAFNEKYAKFVKQ